MKYRLLTKEQFEELNEDFAVFLASQKIDKDKWEQIKKDKPELVQEELELFSDMVWDKVLKHTQFLEHFSEKEINLFKCDKDQIRRIVIRAGRDNFSFLNTDDFKWFIENTNDPSIRILKGKKPFGKDREAEIFKLIESGSVITKGELFTAMEKLL